MTSQKRPGQLGKSPEVQQLNAVEDRMGRLAALLSEVAEALAEYPDGLKLSGSIVTSQPETRPDAIRINAREWPSFDDIEKVLAAWYAARRKVTATNRTPQARRRHASF